MLVVSYIVGAFEMVIGVANGPIDIIVFSVIVVEITKGWPLTVVNRSTSTTSCVRQTFCCLAKFV